MRLFFKVLMLVFVLIACKTNTTKTKSIQIDIQTFAMDSTSIRTIQVINDSIVYYAGSLGDVGYTYDNGKNWEKLQIVYNDTLLPHFRSFAKNDDSFFALSIANPALLYLINPYEVLLVYKEDGEKVFYDSLKFFDDGVHGIAIGDPVTTCPSIILTDDGGKTWCKLPCDNLPIFEDGEAFFAASNTNIKIINNTVWMASGGKNARVFKSTDFGYTWQVFDTPIIHGNGPQGIYSIDFYDENIGVVIGGNYSKPIENEANKAITKDGGETWTLIADKQEPDYKSCIQFIPNSKGKEIIAVGKTGITYSSNYGENWKKISNEEFYVIQFVNDSIAWLGGNKVMGKLTIKK